ncbi:hypothetical protein FHETE_1179 [Fusarium heterosporum]|uniref:Uncharacterized protein n=1 Tax=Fusarium heterosporum TaxID=42747 RepID=A0A8H5TZS4_FUSHE|nr:hypothetical protein FHETE_1179 [Fusarium heterosporum]
MSEYHQSTGPMSGASPSQVPSVSANNPVQIILTPPTPITPTGISLREEDTHKEVHRLPDVSEKEVVGRTDYSDEKQVYDKNAGRDEEEVYIAEEEKEAYHKGLDKEVHSLNLHDGHDEKQVYDQSIPEQKSDEGVNSIATQTYASDPRRDSNSTKSTDLSETQSYYQRHVNKLNQAVDKRKKAWTTFTNQSSTSMTDKYNQMDKDFKDRRMAFENGTTAKMSQLDKSISDSVERTGKSVNTKVANFKQSMVNARSQSISSVKSLGMKCQVGSKETREGSKEGYEPV